MLRKAAAYMLACALLSTSASAATHDHPRVASSSLCGDGYVLALAPERVAALSWQSRHALSRAPKFMQSLPQLWDQTEVLASVDADVIVLGPGEGMGVYAYLSAKGVKFHNLTWSEDFKGVRENIVSVSSVMNVSVKGRALIVDLERRLLALSRRTDLREIRPKLLYLSRSGGTAGPGTFIDAAIAAAGADNIVQAPGWQTLDPEALIGLEPDIILTSFFEGGYESVQAKAVRHAVLRRYIDAHPNIDIPGALWPCAGPSLIDAAEMIANELDLLK